MNDHLQGVSQQPDPYIPTKKKQPTMVIHCNQVNWWSSKWGGVSPKKVFNTTRRSAFPEGAIASLAFCWDFLTTASKVELTRVVLRSHLSHEKEKKRLTFHWNTCCFTVILISWLKISPLPTGCRISSPKKTLNNQTTLGPALSTGLQQ